MKNKKKSNSNSTLVQFKSQHQVKALEYDSASAETVQARIYHIDTHP